MGAKGTAAKRQRQNEKQRLINKAIKTNIKHTTKKLLGIVKDKKKQEAEKFYKEFGSLVDKAVTKGVYHKNNAARKKSRMMKKINAIL
ncbi:MAG: 30S ribosomal protein S20 [Spirochaetales bacterium]|nr:30S ribosomal protein S20 [Spirochaetales bacterium]